MDKETAIKKAAKFKDDWEIDRLQGLAYNKPTGFMLSLGAVWRDSKGKRQFQVLHWYEEDVPGAQRISEEINRLLKEFGILYEAGYMPPLTKEEKEEESRRIHEEAEQARAEFQAQVAKEEEWKISATILPKCNRMMKNGIMTAAEKCLKKAKNATQKKLKK